MRGERLLLAVPRGASITTFGDLLVVVAQDATPFAVNRWTGERVVIDALQAPQAPPGSETWSLEPKE